MGILAKNDPKIAAPQGNGDKFIALRNRDC
jgi:hypothetical protein